MVKDCTSVWDNCLDTIKKNVNNQSFKTWFEPIKAVSLESDSLTIQVPNKFFYEWLEEHYVALLKMTIRQQLGEKGRLEYQILMSNANNSNGLNQATNKLDPIGPGAVDTGNIKNPFVIPGIRKVKIDSQLNPNYLFENFIEGDCNRLARSAGIAIAKKPGGTAFNPLVIFGDVGFDRPPKDLDGMEDRLISRFKWGLSADLQVPDLETRMAILEAKMNKEGVDIPQDVTEFICYNIKNNIRELEGVLISLVAQSSLNRREIDVDLAKEVIKNFVSQMSKEITVDFIQNLVADHFDVPVGKLAGKTRKRSIVIARQLSMYLAKNLTNKSLKAIGENFGGRDHSTVIYSCKAVQDLLDTDMIFKDTVTDLEKKIRLSLNEK